MLKKQIKDFCKSIGLECVGFIRCRRFEELNSFYETRQRFGLQNEYEEAEIEKRINPNHYMAEGKTIISIALFLSYFICKSPLQQKGCPFGQPLFSLDADFSVVCQLSAFPYAA